VWDQEAQISAISPLTLGLYNIIYKLINPAVDCDNTDLSRKSDSLYNLLPTTTSNLVDNEQLDINIDGR